MKREIKYIVVHCSGTNKRATVDSMKRYWKNNLGWKYPGYHDVVGIDGTVTHILDYDTASNGVKGFNSISINVCYIGGLNVVGRASDTRTDEQKKALLELLTNLKRVYPQAIIKGHRDFSPDLNMNGVIEECEYMKDCPGFNAMEEYKNVM